MTLPIGDSAVEIVLLKKVPHPCLRDAVRQGIALNFLFLFLSREKEKNSF